VAAERSFNEMMRAKVANDVDEELSDVSRWWKWAWLFMPNY